MKTGKDIFTLFREGGRHLTVQPSTSAWEKLERRLGSPRREAKLVQIQWFQWAAAAAVVGVIVLAGFYLVQRIEGNLATTFINEPKPAFLETLDTSGDCQPYCLLMNERHRLPAYYAQPVRKEVEL